MDSVGCNRGSTSIMGELSLNNVKYRRSLLATTMIGGVALAMAASPSFAQSQDGSTEVATPTALAEPWLFTTTPLRPRNTAPLWLLGSR